MFVYDLRGWTGVKNPLSISQCVSDPGSAMPGPWSPHLLAAVLGWTVFKPCRCFWSAGLQLYHFPLWQWIRISLLVGWSVGIVSRRHDPWRLTDMTLGGWPIWPLAVDWYDPWRLTERKTLSKTYFKNQIYRSVCTSSVSLLVEMEDSTKKPVAKLFLLKRAFAQITKRATMQSTVHIVFGGRQSSGVASVNVWIRITIKVFATIHLYSFRERKKNPIAAVWFNLKTRLYQFSNANVKRWIFLSPQTQNPLTCAAGPIIVDWASEQPEC